VQAAFLKIAPAARQSWSRLPLAVQGHVETFAGAPDGSRLLIAFPRLIRQVTRVLVNESIAVWLQCEGVHEGIWGGIICPTRRRVAFAEQHDIVTADGRIVSDRVTLDLESILTQLCGPCQLDPDETARLGIAGRGPCGRPPDRTG
jgi:predicted ester cyclase